MLGINERYVNETYDENGILKTYSLNIPENFNFAYDIVDEIARREPDKTAMIWCNWQGHEHIFSFRDMKESSDRMASFLWELGIRKGDMVMLLLKRRYEFWFSMLALHKIGAVAIPGTAMLRAKDLIYRFNAADVKAVICTNDDETAGSVEEAEPESPTLQYKIITHGSRDGWYDLHREMEKADPGWKRPKGGRATNVRDYMLMYFTSGTTGNPKMAMHDFSYPLGQIITAKHWQHVRPGGLHTTLAETGWALTGWGQIYGQWIMECALFVYDFEKFDAHDLMDKIAHYKVTSLCAPPTVYRFLVKEGMEGYDLSSLEYATTAGEALNAEIFKRFYDYTGIKIMEGFGQTESAVLIANLYGTHPHAGAMGKPVPQYQIALLDEDGNPVPDGEVGEICVDTSKGQPAGLLIGYYKDEKRTKEVWHDGYYHTRDTAWRDNDGYYWYVGRTDDVIKSSGYRIGPFEIESVLMEHPAVLECAVTGAPDPIRGQIVKATIVLTHNYKPSEELSKELKSYVKEQTAPYKYPRQIEFVKELPKTSSGKIKRAEIRRRSFEKARA